MDLAGQHVPETCDQGEDLEVQAIGFDSAHDLHPPSPAHALRVVELDELAVALGGARGERQGPRSGWLLRGGCVAAGCPLSRIPVGLAKVRQVAPAARLLVCGVAHQPLAVDAQRKRAPDEGRLPPLKGHPAGDGVVLWKMQSRVGAAQG